MRIKDRFRQHRRDFRAIYVCEHCDFEHEDYGYDDANFHYNVIPDMKCPTCGKKGNGPTSHPIIPAGVVL